MQGTASDWKDFAFSEYLAHGVERPMAMLRKGQYKFNYSLGDAPELYNIAEDPGEFRISLMTRHIKRFAKNLRRNY